MQKLIRIIADDQTACTSGQGSLLLFYSYRFTLMTLSAWFIAFNIYKEEREVQRGKVISQSHRNSKQ